LDEVETARERTKTEFKGKANTLATQMLILNALSSYLGAKAAAEKEAKDSDSDLTNAEKLKKLRQGN